MKAYKIEVLVIDFDDLGTGGIEEVIENVNYPNDCISPRVMKIIERDIGEWDDSNPFNFSNKVSDEYARLFGKDKE